MDPLKTKNLEVAIRRVSVLAMELYRVMENGMTIDFTFPEEEAIVVPGKLPKVRRLIITKPMLHLELQTEPNLKK